MISLSCEKADCGKPLLTCRACRGRRCRDRETFWGGLDR
jgi:hypothetical protein